jgi:hypothetical protein
MARKGIPMNKMSHFDDLMGGRDESWKDVGEPWVVIHAVERDAVEGEQEYDTYDEAWQRATELAQERDPGCATEKEFNVAPKSEVVPGNRGSRFPEEDYYEGYKMKLRDFFIHEGSAPSSKDPDGGKRDREDRLADPYHPMGKPAPHSSQVERAAKFREEAADYAERCGIPREVVERTSDDEILDVMSKADASPENFVDFKWSDYQSSMADYQQDEAVDEGPGDRERPAPDTSGDDPGHEDPMDGNVCPDCKGGNWSSDGKGPCQTCKGMGTADGSNPMDDSDAGDNIVSFDRYLDDVWAYAQQRYNIPAEKLNRWEDAIRNAYNSETPDPKDLIDDIMRTRLGEAFNPDGQKPSEYNDDKFDDDQDRKNHPWGKQAAADDDYAYGSTTKDKKSKKVSEGPHGENAEAFGRVDKKSRSEKKRQDSFKATGEPQIDDPGFAGKDPDEEMFFGSKTPEDDVGTMLDPAAGEEFKGGKVDDFGDDALDPFESPPEGTDDTFNDKGYFDGPGSDVSFPEYEEEPLAPGENWWNKKKSKSFVPSKDPSERHSDIEKAPSFPDDDPWMANYLRKGGKTG